MAERLPRLLLRLEGLAVAAAGVALYVREDFGWLLFVLLILAPDLSALGYLAGPRAGSVSYDLAHTTALPVALDVAGVLAGAGLPVQLA